MQEASMHFHLSKGYTSPRRSDHANTHNFPSQLTRSSTTLHRVKLSCYIFQNYSKQEFFSGRPIFKACHYTQLVSTVRLTNKNLLWCHSTPTYEWPQPLTTTIARPSAHQTTRADHKSRGLIPEPLYTALTKTLIEQRNGRRSSKQARVYKTEVGPSNDAEFLELSDV
jgi:hypothetical protein